MNTSRASGTSWKEKTTAKTGEKNQQNHKKYFYIAINRRWFTFDVCGKFKRPHLIETDIAFFLLWHSYQTKCETSKCMRHWMSIRWTTKKSYSLNLNKPINVHIKMEQLTQHQKIARKICNIIEASKTMATDCSTTFFYMFYIEFYFWLWDMYFWFLFIFSTLKCNN